MGQDHHPRSERREGQDSFSDGHHDVIRIGINADGNGKSADKEQLVYGGYGDSEKAKFGQPETGLGIIPGFGGTQRLPRLVGKAKGKLMIMTGEIIGAQEAYEIGLVEKVVPADELMNAAEELANTIKSKAPIAVAVTKTVVNNGYGLDMKTASALEMEAFTAPFASQDKSEGMLAFLEKRTPEFKNK